MKTILIALTALFIVIQSPYSQNNGEYHIQNKLKLKNSATTDFTNTFIWSSILVISPTLVIEDKRSFFGLSKEFSAGKFPYGRAEFDYTYIFRNENAHQLHLSYNLDIPTNFNFRQPSIFMISPGAGYYTDLTNKSYFVQLAIGLWASTGFLDGLSIHPNLKFRKVFKKDNYPGAFEISLGVGFGFYSN